MTRELERSEWKTFFDDLSRELADWETTVQVFNNETGAQILSEGLPFNGLTLDEKGGKECIELSIGSDVGNHQTHSVFEPLKVAFEPGGRGPNGTLDIEDVSGTKTLITFVQPMPVLVEYASAEIVETG